MSCAGLWASPGATPQMRSRSRGSRLLSKCAAFGRRCALKGTKSVASSSNYTPICLFLTVPPLLHRSTFYDIVDSMTCLFFRLALFFTSSFSSQSFSKPRALPSGALPEVGEDRAPQHRGAASLTCAAPKCFGCVPTVPLSSGTSTRFFFSLIFFVYCCLFLFFSRSELPTLSPTLSPLSVFCLPNHLPSFSPNL